VASTSPIGPFDLGSGPTIGVRSYSGSITNVVENPLDPGFATGQPSNFASGDFSSEVLQFGLRVEGQLLFTRDPVTFGGHVDGLPPSLVTTMVSPDQVGVYWTNSQNGSDLLVAYSVDRRLISIPEPTSLIRLGLGLSSLAVWGRMRRRTCRIGRSGTPETPAARAARNAPEMSLVSPALRLGIASACAVQSRARGLVMPLRDHFRPPLEKRHSWDELHGGWLMIVVQIGYVKSLPARPSWPRRESRNELPDE
jgi:hypothetical protein